MDNFIEMNNVKDQKFITVYSPGKSKDDFQIVNNYYNYEKENKNQLPLGFAQSIIELENEIDKVECNETDANETTIEQLATLYKVN
jgi:hypothetical protein